MTSKEIGAIIKEARLSKKMTQNEVVGDFITRNMLSLIENGTATPSVRTLQYLAAKLQIPMSRFTFDENIGGTQQSSELALWQECKQSYRRQDYQLCLEQLTPFLSTEHFLYDEACALTAICYLKTANTYSISEDLSSAVHAAKQATIMQI